MPSIRRTVNDLGGSMVEDPMDRIESDNRNANMQASQFNYGAQQNSALTALALARLKQSDYQFGQGRADQMAVFREGLAAQNHQADLNAGMHREDLAQGMSFHNDDVGYRATHDAREDARYADTMDPEKNPGLKAQIMGNVALQRLLDRNEKTDARTDKNLARADAAADKGMPAGGAPAFRDKFEEQVYNAGIAAGKTPAEALLDITKSRRDSGAKTAERLAPDYGTSLDEAQSGSIPIVRYLSGFGELSSGARESHAKENAGVMDKRAQMKQALIDSGVPPVEAEAQLHEIERKHRVSSPTLQAERLYKSLGWE